MSINFIGSLPESLTQGLLVGKLLVGGLGVPCDVVSISSSHRILRPISLIRISLIRFQGLDLKKKSPINDQKLCALSSDSHGKLRFRQGLDRKSGNLIKEIGRTSRCRVTGSRKPQRSDRQTRGPSPRPPKLAADVAGGGVQASQTLRSSVEGL